MPQTTVLSEPTEYNIKDREGRDYIELLHSGHHHYRRKMVVDGSGAHVVGGDVV